MGTARKNPVRKLAARAAALTKRIASLAVSRRSVETLWEDEDHAAELAHGDPVPDPWDPADETDETSRLSDGRVTSGPVRQKDTSLFVHDRHPRNQPVSFRLRDRSIEDVAPLDDLGTFDGDVGAFDIDGSIGDHSDPEAWDDGLDDSPNDEIDRPVSDPSYAFDDPDLDLSGWDDFDDYDPDARQLPWGVPPPDATRIATGKAANLVRHMSFSSRTDQDAALRYLTDFFEHLPHPATYRALRALAENLRVDEIEAMVSLRDSWLDCDAWTGGFSWRLAYRICRARSEYTPDTMIDDDWLSEWRSPESRYRWFSVFIESRLDAQNARRLDEALRIRAEHENLNDQSEPPRTRIRRLTDDRM